MSSEYSKYIDQLQDLRAKLLYYKQDNAKSRDHNSIVSMIPNQNTAKHSKQSFRLFRKKFEENKFQNTWICLQSEPLAGNVILLKVIGHLSETLIAVCSTPSSTLIPDGLLWVGVIAPLLKLRLIFVTQWSRGNNRFLNKPCNTDLTVGLCTSCSKNKCDY